MLYRPDVQHLYNVERRRIQNPSNTRMRLQRLEKPDVWSVELLRKIQDSLELDKIQQYPDYQPFYEVLAAFVGVDKKNLVVGAGIEDFIRNLFILSVCPPHDVVAYSWPTCAMFDLYSKVFKANTMRISHDLYNRTTTEMLIEMLARAESRVGLFILTNPGQPVENCFSLDELQSIASYCHMKHIVFAIDEAYYHFGAQTALSLVDKFDNLLVLRTFSKAFGAASIRVGYAVGQERVLKPLEAIRLSGEVTGPSMRIASILMENFDSYVKQSIQEICESRDWLRQRIFYDMSLQTFGEVANHVLINLRTMDGRNRVNMVVKNLASNGVYVKSNFPEPLQEFIMVTSGSRDLIESFYSAFQSAIAKELLE